MLTPEKLKKLIDADSTRQKKAANQLAYVHGEHPGILEPDAKEEPDNRIPVPFARRAVEMVCGYLAKPGNIVYAGDGYDDALKDTFEANDETLETAELLRTALTHGKAFELHWTQTDPEFKQVPYAQCVPVYDGNLKPKMTEFIRYWTDEEGIGQADVYDAVVKQHFIKLISTVPWQIDGPAEPHGYKRVPVVEFKIDPDGLNVFDHVVALIDAFDKIISENYANDLQSLSSAILLLANAVNKVPEDPDIDPVSDAEKIIQRRLKYLDKLVLDGPGSVTDKVAYLTKNIDPAFPGSAAQIIERLIYEMLQLFNPNDDVFNTPSGEAAKWKIISFEYLCTKITQYFTLGLQDRISLIKGLNETLTGDAQITEVTIDWKRNLPSDIAILANIAVALDGILSQETILKLFPSYVVEDVKEEIKKLKKEKEERMKDAPKLFPAGQPGQNQEKEEEANGQA